MNYRLEFDESANLFLGRYCGPVSEEQFLRDMAASTRVLAPYEPCKAILNLSEVTEFNVSSHAVHNLAFEQPRRPPGPRVVVAKHDLVYGLSRMFQMLGDRTYTSIQVVRTLDEAYSVLKIDPAELHLHPVELPDQSE